MTASQETVSTIPVVPEAANDASFNGANAAQGVRRSVEDITRFRLMNLPIVSILHGMIDPEGMMKRKQEEAALMVLVRAQATEAAANDPVFSVEVVAPAANDGEIRKAA